jgi:hypothetical protein
MIELTELHYMDQKTLEYPVLLNPRHIVSVRPAQVKLYGDRKDNVWRVKLVTSEVIFVKSKTLGNDPEAWARALSEEAA